MADFFPNGYFDPDYWGEGYFQADVAGSISASLSGAGGVSATLTYTQEQTDTGYHARRLRKLYKSEAERWKAQKLRLAALHKVIEEVDTTPTAAVIRAAAVVSPSLGAIVCAIDDAADKASQVRAALAMARAIEQEIEEEDEAVALLLLA